ncbi:flagellar basal-body MS-ring/collar protein FliF [Poseidonocella sedimentorum]|uniref:Flagellar M-ring protein n=1 Tax=Poseidonocella sedimentorum TaxID=871652 RepID=A0A1I6D5L4_9RHOB|nr:flagellar basal-body MS-ring/collar protein FliF [Poseidonocella sedimentorum]SFR00748.1 flagellar M-ring protein FliF [Poseidonocella sedimentorum]
MQQLLNVWNTLTWQRRLIAAAAAIGVFIAVLGLSRIATAPNLTLLYAGLESDVAGEVVNSLDQRGVVYEVRGDSIYVDTSERDSLRMMLASEGLPSTSSKGYDLLDGLSGFSTTSQMFDAAYLRAKEGELARTIAASPHIRSARVHIANVGSNPFQRNQRASASVTVVAANGAITPGNAKALSHLVSSAVAGLSPDNVAVIDSSGNLIGAAEDQSSVPINEERASALRERVVRLLEARVGHGNAVVEVSVDTVTEQESIVERRFDPEARVAISTETEERSTNDQDSGGGDVTVASNLPDGTGAAGGGSSSSQNSQTLERINYEVSETQREVLRQPGDTKRITVAVLVNGTARAAGEEAAEFSPRDEGELEALRELVASSVGFDETRGDVITIKSMEFAALQPLGTASETSWFQTLGLKPANMIQMAVLAIVALVLGLFVLRPIIANQTPALGTPLALPGRGGEAGLPGEAEEAITGEIDFDDLPQMNVIEEPAPEFTAIAPTPAPAPAPASNDPVARLRAMIGERQDETVEILRSWMEEKEENA